MIFHGHFIYNKYWFIRDALYGLNSISWHHCLHCHLAPTPNLWICHILWTWFNFTDHGQSFLILPELITGNIREWLSVFKGSCWHHCTFKSNIWYFIISQNTLYYSFPSNMLDSQSLRTHRCLPGMCDASVLCFLPPSTPAWNNTRAWAWLCCGSSCFFVRSYLH